MAEISCEQVSQCLADFVDGELDAEMNAQIKDHIEKCNFCQELVESYVKTIFILKKVNEVEPPADIVVRLRNYLLSKLNL